MRLYASEAELAAWLSPKPVPADAGDLLLSASNLIRSETKRAVYAADTDGYATDTAVREAFRNAACAQVKFWADNKINPALGPGGVGQLAASKSIGGASISYAIDPTATQARAAAAGTLGPDAYYVLDDAGLLGGTVRSL